MNQALKGLKVLDLTMNLPGPYMTWLLAGLGADVLKVENPDGGDYARALGGRKDEPPLFFTAVNRNKKSLALNLKDPEGRELLMKLLDHYDVLVEGFRPGTMENLGLDYDTTSARQPRLIYVSITGYGHNGPYRLRAGHDLNYLSQAGIIAMNGTRDGELTIPAIPIADLAAGSLMSLGGLLAAVIQRERTGQGQFVDTAMYDGSIALTSAAFSLMLDGMGKPVPGGNFMTGGYAFYGLYPAKDGRYMSLGAVESKFWVNFCRAVDREDLIPRQWDGPDVTEEIKAIFSSRTQAEWVELMKDVDACCEAVLPLDEAADSPLSRARGSVVTWPDGNRFMASPFKLSDSPPPEDQPAPALGRNTREILAELGVSEKDADGLAERGVI